MATKSTKNIYQPVQICAPKCTPITNISHPDVRTITIVPKIATWKKDNVAYSYKMEGGRQAAQAGHGVSKLKISYLIQNSKSLEDYSYNAGVIFDNPITSIVLEARDSKELTHIYLVATIMNLHHVRFWDDGAIYQNSNVLTAVSIGPITPDQLAGVFDYLPLLNCENK